MNDCSLHNFGDPIEKENYSLIKEKFPCYEEIWRKYVGNNGLSNPISEQDICNIIWQYNYCYFRNLLILKKVLQEQNSTDENKSKGDKLIIFEAKLLLAVHIIYNSIELLDLIDTEIRKKEKTDNERFKKTDLYADFIAFRNHLSHNTRIIYTLKGDSFLLPSINKFQKINGKELIWSKDVFSDKYDSPQSLEEFILNYEGKLIGDFNTILKEELSFFENKNFTIISKWPELEYKNPNYSGSI